MCYYLCVTIRCPSAYGTLPHSHIRLVWPRCEPGMGQVSGVYTETSYQGEVRRGSVQCGWPYFTISLTYQTHSARFCD